MGQVTPEEDIVRNSEGEHIKSLCPCVRCRGFQPGHPRYGEVGGFAKPTHGAYMTPIKLQPDADRIADMVRPLLPVYNPAFEGTFQTYCILLARIERAHRALEAVDDGTWEEQFDGKKPGPLLAEDMRRWTNAALKHAQQLGLTPASAAAIMKDAREGLGLGGYRPPSQEELSQVPLPALRKLRDALTEALEPPAIDAA